MKNRVFAIAALAVLFSVGASAQTQYKWYGFIRNFFTYDTHESSAGTEDLYYYMPTDNDGKGTSNFTAITSRIGLDVTGYEVSGYSVDAKIEADFYSKNTNVAVLRLRQAYLTVDKDSRSWKVGQAWHPMAVDLPDIFSLESGAPFGPFSRTPQVTLESKIDNENSFTASAIWQMQYPCTGPEGVSSNYIKYSGIPELYLGYNYASGKYLSRVGIDYLSIKPLKDDKGRMNAFNVYMYDQFTGDKWSFKNKFTYATDGSHMNMVGGYGVCGVNGDAIEYAATNSISDWFSMQYKGENLRPALFLGYIKMFGTNKDIIGDFYQKNSASSVNQMYRIQPELVYNLGKLAFGFEYQMTAVHYGKSGFNKLATENLHWVYNHRIQLMVKYTF